MPRYELRFNTDTGLYEIWEITTSGLNMGEEKMVVPMTSHQWNQFTYTVDGAEDTRTIHEDTQVIHNG